MATASHRERLEKIQETSPDLSALAEALSLAVRVEPELLRAIRLSLLPRSQSHLEADFFYCALVAQRTPDWLVLDVRFAAELRRSVGRGIRENASYRERAGRIRTLIKRLHAEEPYEIRCEEEIIWLAVAQPEGKAAARETIDGRLRTFFWRMLAPGAEAKSLARWFSAAERRMPELATEAEAFAMLYLATSSLLGGARLKPPVAAGADTFETLSRYLPASVPRIPVWAGLTTRGLHLRPLATERYREINLPLTDPILLEVQPEGASPQLVQLAPGQELFLPLPNTAVALRTLTRDLLQFRAKPQETETPKPTAAPKPDLRAGRPPLRIFMCYAKEDQDFVRSLVYDITKISKNRYGRPYEIFMEAQNLAKGESWEEAVQREIAQADCVIMVIGTAFSESAWVRRELDLALAGRQPIIPILIDGSYELIPSSLRDTQALDFRKQRPLKELLRAIEGSITRSFWLVGVPPLPEQQSINPRDLERLDALLIERRLVALIGPGGVGKTRLMAAYAHGAEARERFSDGIVWLEARERDDLLKQFQAALFELWSDVPTSQPESQLLESANLLVIVDGAEYSDKAEDAETTDAIEAKRISRPVARRFLKAEDAETTDAIGVLLGRLGARSRLLFASRSGSIARRLDAAVLELKPRPRIDPDRFVALYAAKRHSLTPPAVKNLEIFIRLLSEDQSLIEVSWMVFLVALAEHETGWLFLEEQGDREDRKFKGYERLDLGNTRPGDGYRYRGRGYLMLTGRANYEHMGRKLGLQLVEEPDLLSDPPIAYRALSLWLMEKGLSNVLGGDKVDYLGAGLAVFGDRKQAERVLRAAEEIEPLVRESLVQSNFVAS